MWNVLKSSVLTEMKRPRPTVFLLRLCIFLLAPLRLPAPCPLLPLLQSWARGPRDGPAELREAVLLPERCSLSVTGRLF